MSDDLAGLGQDEERHPMAHILTDPDEPSKELSWAFEERWVAHHVEDRLIEDELEEH
jgi:hypothetical protein